MKQTSYLRHVLWIFFLVPVVALYANLTLNDQTLPFTITVAPDTILPTQVASGANVHAIYNITLEFQSHSRHSVHHLGHTINQIHISSIACPIILYIISTYLVDNSLKPNYISIHPI